MRIETVEAILVDIPTTRAHHLSFGAVTEQNYVIVKVFAEGLVGIGEASTIGGPAWGEESTESIKAIIDTYLTPHLIGKDARQLNRLAVLMDTAVRGNRFAKAAIDMALHDLVARSRRVAVYDLLGGKVHDAIPVAWTLAAGDTARDIAEAEEMLQRRRHNIFKLKIGAREPAIDFAHVEKICKAVADRASIRVDVNQAWDELTAAKWIPRFAAAGVDLFEQPVPKWNHAALARLASGNACAIMADESVDTVQTAFELAKGRRRGQYQEGRGDRGSRRHRTLWRLHARNRGGHGGLRTGVRVDSGFQPGLRTVRASAAQGHDHGADHRAQGFQGVDSGRPRHRRGSG